jgi:hypothetical protein
LSCKSQKSYQAFPNYQSDQETSYNGLGGVSQGYFLIKYLLGTLGDV